MRGKDKRVKVDDYVGARVSEDAPLNIAAELYKTDCCKDCFRLTKRLDKSLRL